MEEKREREKREAVKVRVTSLQQQSLQFYAPCNIGNAPNHPGPALPNNHWQCKSFFGRLGLPENSSRDLIRKHYKKLALLYHPDKQKPGQDFSARFQAIKEAYEMLN